MFTVTINGEDRIYSANTAVDIFLDLNDEFVITPTSTSSILTLEAWPGALGVFYDWLEGVSLFSGILFDMNDLAMYEKWNQGHQGLYHVQYAQYKNCIFWSDNAYISNVAQRPNYTLYYSSELPLCYSTIPENTFKSFYFAYNVTSDPNWSNPVYKSSFALATHATQVFSYYGLSSIGLFDMDSSDFNIVLPKDCRGLMFYSPNIKNAGVFDAINCTNFGAKSGSWRDAFAYCYSLENLYIKNLKVNLNISWSPITQQALEFIVDSAANTKQITISLSPYTYYRLTDNIKTLASEKNIKLELIKTNTNDEDIRVSKLIVDGDGNSFLANDGTYKTIDTNDGVILYEASVDSANFSSVTLSQSVSSFNKLEVCCCTDEGVIINIITLYNPNNSVFDVSSTIQKDNQLIIKSKQYTIVDNIINGVDGVGGMVTIAAAENGFSAVDGNYIGIYKVIGY